MNNGGPILIIEDDLDDQLTLTDIFQELNYANEIVFFEDGMRAVDYIRTCIQPFLIISDINMPKITGFELRDIIQNDEYLRMKCIPYLFLSTSDLQEHIATAYSRSSQGFFVKPSNYTAFTKVISNIMEYWTEAKSPAMGKKTHSLDR